MKKGTAVMYGAGNIGRGFIGQLFYESGYETVFIDVADPIIEQLNRDGRYPVTILDNQNRTDVWVENVRAVNGKNVQAAAEEIAHCEIMATAAGIALRLRLKPDQPLNIILCENSIDADSSLREEVRRLLPPADALRLDQAIGFVRSSVGRMVPAMAADMQAGNPLRIGVEAYCVLPVDQAAFRGAIPAIRGLQPKANFDFYIRRKLFIHNLGHASCAYLGKQKDYEYIFEAIADAAILAGVRQAMLEAATALSQEYQLQMTELTDHVVDLLRRFANSGLRDTVERVARDPLRKLGSNDRLLGAALLCIKHKLPCPAIISCIRAALAYQNEQDPSSLIMQTAIREQGLKGFLVHHEGLDEAMPEGKTLLAMLDLPY
jgi:mannitol-1-phosphate 5-dehydrogenase